MSKTDGTNLFLLYLFSETGDGLIRHSIKRALVRPQLQDRFLDSQIFYEYHSIHDQYVNTKLNKIIDCLNV